MGLIYIPIDAKQVETQLTNDTKFMINFTGTTKLFEEKNEDYEKIQEMLGSNKINENE